MSREELLHDLESPVDVEEGDCDDDPPLIEADPSLSENYPPLMEDPPATSVTDPVNQVSFPATTQASRRATMKGFVWKVKKLVLNPDQIAFRGNITFPAELRNQSAGGTPYIFFDMSVINSWLIYKEMKSTEADSSILNLCQYRLDWRR